MGPDAQEQLSVGVGALAGSTIMLITLPWFLAIYAARVDVHGDRCTYKKPKLSAMFLHGPKEEVAEGESLWALAALIVCLIAFFAYLGYQSKLSQSGTDAAHDFMIEAYKLSQSGTDAAHEFMIEAVIAQKIKEGKISLLGALKAIMALHPTRYGPGEESVLLGADGDPLVNRMKAILYPFFYRYGLVRAQDLYGLSCTHSSNRYDINQNGHINSNELGKVMSDLGIHVRESNQTKPNQTQTLTKPKPNSRYDINQNGHIDSNELGKVMSDLGIHARESSVDSVFKDFDTDGDNKINFYEALKNFVPAGEDDEEEEEEMPEDFVDLPPNKQQQRIFQRSCTLMGLGTFLVLLFSSNGFSSAAARSWA
eukprot:gene7194-303_t